ncbi:MAG TPA: hypothetical protein VMF91_04125 [Bryobacteraceae bacterium]|nr:hypothetical protein [Bryobacteraceae bacterium]
MAAAGAAGIALQHSTKLVVGIGGTGKISALAYTRIAKLIGLQPNVAVIDFPPNHPGYTDVDRRVDEALDREGIWQRIRTLPDRVPNVADTLREALGLDQNLADAIFSLEQQNVSPIEGANQQPQVGAVLARWKLSEETDRNSLQGWFSDQYTDIYILAGLGGGTGAGFGPTLCQYAKETTRGQNVHGVFLLPWAKIGNLGVGDAGQARNAKSLLRYFDVHATSICDHLVLIGTPRGVNPYDASAGLAIPVHSTLLLSALYVLKREDWGGTAQPARGRSWMVEVEAKGIPLQDIVGPRGNLFDMLVHSRRIERCLAEILGQAPADRLSKGTLWPMGTPLSWKITEWITKLLADHSRIRAADAWRLLANQLALNIRLEATRREWIMDLADANRTLIDFNRRDVDANARMRFGEYLSEVEQDAEYRRLELDQQTPEQASAFLCSWIRNRADQLMLESMNRRKKK